MPSLILTVTDLPVSAFESYRTGQPLPTVFIACEAGMMRGHLYLTVEDGKLQSRHGMSAPMRSGVMTLIHAHAMRIARERGLVFLSELKKNMSPGALALAEKLNRQGLSKDVGDLFVYDYDPDSVHAGEAHCDDCGAVLFYAGCIRCGWTLPKAHEGEHSHA
jgi:hypothetical protein